MSASDAPILARSAEPEIILQHYRTIEERHDIVEDAKAGEIASIAAAAESGIDVKALKHARKVVKMGPRDGKTYLENLSYYVNLISGGMLGQEELFPTDAAPIDESVLKVQKQWILNRDAEAMGYNAGKTGEPADNNPFGQETEQRSRWAREWANGHEEFLAAKGAQEIAPKKDKNWLDGRREEPEEPAT